jgi:TP901 family phage tail tape measure protein
VIEVAHIVARVTTDLTRFNTGMAAAEARATTTAEKMSVSGMRMTKYLSLPLAAIGYSAVKSSIHFSDAMAQIRTQTGASRKEMEYYQKAIMKLAPSTTQGPEELAKGLYHLRSVGLKGKEAMDALKYSAQASQMGFADLEDTTSVLAGTMRVLHLPMSKLKDTMAAMHAAVGTGNMRLEDLNRALGTGVLATAHLAHLGLRDVTASMAVFTDENQNAASSMTRMRTALMMMLHPSEKAAGNMNMLGFNAQQLGVKIQTGAHGWEDAIAFIDKRRKQFIKMAQQGKGFDGDKIIKIPKMTLKEARTASFANLAGAFGGSKTASQIMLLINNSDMLRKKWVQNRQVEKHWDQQLADSNKTLGAQLRKAWSSIRVGLIQLGDAMAPTVVAFAKGIALLALGFSKLPGPVKKFVGALVFMLILLGPMLIVGSSLSKMWKGYAESTKLAAAGQWMLNAATASFPLTAIVLLIAIIVIAMWKSKRFREFMIKVFRDVWDFIKKAVSGIWSFVKQYWPYIIGAMLGPIGLAAAWIYRHWHTIVSAFHSGVNAVVGFLKANWPYIVGAMLGPFGLIAAGIYKHFGAIKAFIVRISLDILNFIKGTWSKFAGIIASFGVRIYSGATGVWHRIWNYLKGLAGRLGSAVKNAMLAIVRWIKAAAIWAYTASKHLGTRIKDGVVDGMKGMAGDIAKGIGGGLLSAIPGGKELKKGVHALIHHRATGGPVNYGMPYVVGERGPEWFTPTQSGRIAPNGQEKPGRTASVHVENMNVRATDDIYSIASVLARKVALA